MIFVQRSSVSFSDQTYMVRNGIIKLLLISGGVTNVILQDALVDGGDATYLCYWLRESDLVDLISALTDMDWVGVSAGPMMMTPRIGTYFLNQI